MRPRARAPLSTRSRAGQTSHLHQISGSVSDVVRSNVMPASGKWERRLVRVSRPTGPRCGASDPTKVLVTPGDDVWPPVGGSDEGGCRRKKSRPAVCFRVVDDEGSAFVAVSLARSVERSIQDRCSGVGHAGKKRARCPDRGDGHSPLLRPRPESRARARTRGSRSPAPCSSRSGMCSGRAHVGAGPSLRHATGDFQGTRETRRRPRVGRQLPRSRGCWPTILCCGTCDRYS